MAKDCRHAEILLLVFATLLLASLQLVEAQQAGKVPRIGYLDALSRSTSPGRIEAFRQGLRELGYVEGKTIVIEWRFAEGKRDRLAEFAAELARLKVDVIVTGGSATTPAAKQATVTIPIVMTQDADPVGNGFVASLSRPGGNITGLSNLSPGVSGKRLGLLKEIVPKLSRVAVLGTSTQSGNAEALKETELAAGALGVQLQYLDVRSPTDIATAFQEASKGQADAVVVLTSPVFVFNRTRVLDLMQRGRLPAIYHRHEFVEDGGLMAYGPNVTDLTRRAATYVDKILKGAKPADLPVEQPTRFELIINLKAARHIGLTIPPNMLVRADKVIE